MSSLVSWLPSSGLLLLSLLVVLVATEVLLRLWALVNSDFAVRLKRHDLLSVQIEPMGRDGYRQRPNAVFHYWTGSIIKCNPLGYRGPAVAMPKNPGTLRVVLVGGSATYGWGVQDDETIDFYLRRRLAARVPDRRVEVINLAYDGYDSYQVYERIRVDGVRFDPDVIIVNSGINDVQNARFANLQGDPDPRTILWLSLIRALRAQQERRRPAVRVLLKHYLYVLRFASLLRASPVKPSVWEDRLGKPFEPNWGVVDYFERNLRRAAAIAADHGAAFLLSPEPSGIPGNLAADAVSPRDYWITNAGVTQQIREAFAARMGDVAAELRAQGQRVAFAPHRLSADMFIDDAHLKPAGNDAMAADFEVAILALLESSQPARVPLGASR